MMEHVLFSFTYALKNVALEYVSLHSYSWSGPGNIRGGYGLARRKPHTSVTGPTVEVLVVVLLPSLLSPASQVASANLPLLLFSRREVGVSISLSIPLVRCGLLFRFSQNALVLYPTNKWWAWDVFPGHIRLKGEMWLLLLADKSRFHEWFSWRVSPSV